MGLFRSSPTYLISIVLEGSFEKEFGERDRTPLRYDHLERQITEILFSGHGEIPLIDQNYHFVTAGAFSYSQEVNSVFWIFREIGAMTYIMGENGEMVEPAALIFGKNALEKKLVSKKDYEKLKNLGKKLKTTGN